ncbi:MAG: transposase [Pirellulales bacterium]
MSKKHTFAVADPAASAAISTAARVPGRRWSSEEFQRKAVRLIAEGRDTFKAAAAAVGVSENSLCAWHCQVCAATGGVRLDENKRLRQQLWRAELEREIPKQATAHFAKESL